MVETTVLLENVVERFLISIHSTCLSESSLRLRTVMHGNVRG